MKKLLKTVFPLVILALLVSCDSLSSLFDVDFETTLSGTLHIDVENPVTKAADAIPFQANDTIDPLSDDEIAEYAEKIVNVNADSVLVEVDSVNMEGVVFLAGTSITVSNETNTATWTITTDWPIVEGTTVGLDDVGGIYDAVSDILTTLEVFTVSAQGTCTKSGVVVVLRLDIETTVTGNPL
jgi:hypothetical protein